MLYIMDAFGTLCTSTGELLENTKERVEELRDGGHEIAIATNQGGAAMRHLYLSRGDTERAQNYPSQGQIEEMIWGVASTLSIPYVCISFAYMLKDGTWVEPPENVVNDREWRRSWRKPYPGMLERAMEMAEVPSSDTVMVGDRLEDLAAANNACTHFVHAEEFFRRNNARSTVILRQINPNGMLPDALSQFAILPRMPMKWNVSAISLIGPRLGLDPARLHRADVLKQEDALPLVNRLKTIGYVPRIKERLHEADHEYRENIAGQTSGGYEFF